MIRPEFREALESQHGILVKLWVAFIVAIFLYVWIADTVLPSRRLLAGPAAAEAGKVIIWLLTLVDLGSLAWWKKRFLNKQAILGGAKKYRLLQALQEHKTPLEEQAAGIVSSYVTSKIVAFAMMEALAVYGFGLALIGRYVWHQYLLSLASGLLLVWEFPSKSFLEEIIRDVEAGETSKK